MPSPTCTPYRFKQHGPSHLNAEGAGNLRLALVIHSPHSLASSEAPPRSHVDFGRELALDFPLHSVSPPTPLPSQLLGSFVPSRVCLPHGSWPLMWVDMGQPLLSFCFWTGDVGCESTMWTQSKYPKTSCTVKTTVASLPSPIMPESASLLPSLEGHSGIKWRLETFQSLHFTCVTRSRCEIHQVFRGGRMTKGRQVQRTGGCHRGSRVCIGCWQEGQARPRVAKAFPRRGRARTAAW